MPTPATQLRPIDSSWGTPVWNIRPVSDGQYLKLVAGEIVGSSDPDATQDLIEWRKDGVPLAGAGLVDVVDLVGPGLQASYSAGVLTVEAAVMPLPVGAMFFSGVPTDPAILLGYGTWALIAAGRMIVGLDMADPDFAAAGNTGGEKAHTLTDPETPGTL